VSKIILFNKPFGVLSQFTDADGRATLKDFIDIPDVYPIGRLDKDSEGLLALTDDGKLKHHLAHPKHKVWKTYWVQVEGTASVEAIEQLTQGVKLKDGLTKPAKVRTLETPDIWDREPPIRVRASIPDQWLEIQIREGKNRQIRRMTAAVDLPTLRLVRVAIGEWTLGNLALGESTTVTLPKNNNTQGTQHGLETSRHSRRHRRTRR